MARVSLIDEENRPELSGLIAKIRGARGGRLLNIYRIMLHSPALAGGWFELNQAVRFNTEVDGQSRELAMMRVAILNDVDLPPVASLGATSLPSSSRGFCSSMYRNPNLSTVNPCSRL